MDEKIAWLMTLSACIASSLHHASRPSTTQWRWNVLSQLWVQMQIIPGKFTYVGYAHLMNVQSMMLKIPCNIQKSFKNLVNKYCRTVWQFKKNAVILVFKTKIQQTWWTFLVRGVLGLAHSKIFSN